ncbi:MAG: alpha/beta hydrolase [Pseudomonadota bacterium]
MSLKILLGVAVTLIAIGITMVQPAYFFAKPSQYSLFSALVADRGITVTRDVPYGAVARNKLDIYEPSKETRSRRAPIIVFLYGGTWREGDRAIYGFLGATLASRGYTVVIPDYRLFPEVRFPSFVEDTAAAYSFVAKRFDDPARPIVVMGHSAGAHMAAFLAFDANYLPDSTRRPAALVGLAGPYAFDLTTYETTADLFTEQQDATKTIPANFVTSSAPPTLLLHGANDETVKRANQKVLAEKLRSVGTTVETHIPPGLSHVGLVRAFAWPFRTVNPVVDIVDAFLQRHASGDTG